MSGRIVKVSGPLIVAEGMKDVELYDVVRVSEKRLIGEVIELRDDKASIEVYGRNGRPCWSGRTGGIDRFPAVRGTGPRPDRKYF